MSSCPDPYFDTISSNGLAVSHGGELVVLGSWGCGNVYGNLKAWRGFGGSGKPIIDVSTPGQIWAVDAAVSLKSKQGFVAAGAWRTGSSIPSQVVLYSSHKIDE